MTNETSFSGNADAHLTLVTLGGWALLAADSTAAMRSALGPSKALALLGYLALSPAHTARREHLLDLLWADLEPDAAAHAYRQTVWYLRQRVGDGVLVAGAGTLTLGCSVETDRDRFLAAIEAQDFETAVTLYAGDFLPGFAAPGGAEFEKWADLERYRLRGHFARAASALVRQRLGETRFKEAVALARRVRDCEPLSEAGWRLLIEALISSGDEFGAAVESDQIERMLASEGREPEPATRATLRLARKADRERDSANASAGAEAEALRSTASLVAELIGREGEFQLTLEAWHAVATSVVTHEYRAPGAGAGRHVHLTGAAGLGKTRLLTDLHHRLRALGAPVAILRANPGERRVPFAFAAELAAALAALPGSPAISPGSAALLVHLNPTLSARFPNTTRPHLLDSDAVRLRTVALAELLRVVSEERPVALLLDDIHWADEESRLVLDGLLSRAASERALILTTARPVAEGEVSRPDTQRLALDPLTAAQVGALLASLGSIPDAKWSADVHQHIHSATNGSPLLVLETLQLAVDRGALALREGAWECPDHTALIALLESGGALHERVEMLAREPRWLLTVLAVAGRPLTLDVLARATPRRHEALRGDLDALEHRGLVARANGEWLPAHDEIAAQAIALAEPEALQAAHRVVGGALAEMAGNDPALLRIAAQHLAAAGDAEALRHVFEAYFAVARARRDRRAPRALAQDLVGQSGGDNGAAATRLAASLPFWRRVGLDRPPRAVSLAAVALALLATSWAVVQRDLNPPDTTLLLAWQDSAGTQHIGALPVYADRLEQLAGVEVRDLKRPGPEVPSGEGLRYGAPSPDGSRWAYSAILPDTGGLEVALRDRSGHTRRLTFTPGDDFNPTWAPDGRRLAFATARWDAGSSMSDVALTDVDTGGITRLSRGRASEASPRWSPDGSRVAFVRRHLIDPPYAPPEICWITPDGGNEHCFVLISVDASSIAGWVDDHRIVVLVDSAGVKLVGLVDIDRQNWNTVLEDAATATVSPDGRWFAALLEAPSLPTRLWYLLDAEHADRRQVLQLVGQPGTKLGDVYFGHTASRRAGTRIFASPHAALVPAGERFRLRVFASTRSGDFAPVLASDWTSSDTSVAQVDAATGTVTGRRPGRATVRVNVGGEVRDSATVIVEAPVVRDVMAETWAGASGRWVYYGDPRPTIVTGPQGVQAFWNRGDGSWMSGAYSKSTFPAGSGVGVEAQLWTLVTRRTWQLAGVELTGGIDSTLIAGWDHVNGAIPVVAREYNARTCGAMHGTHESGRTRRGLAVSSNGIWAVRQPHGDLHAGGWWRLRIQIFPDGRCGIAVNGVPVVVFQSRLELDRPMLVHLSGNSVGTKMLVGPLQIWTGVKGGVDWSLLDSAGTGSRQPAAVSRRRPP